MKNSIEALGMSTDGPGVRGSADPVEGRVLVLAYHLDGLDDYLPPNLSLSLQARSSK